MLTVVERAGSTPQYLAKWKCRCECGNFVVKIGSELRYRKEQTHACHDCAKLLLAQTVAKRMTRHGESGTYLHRAWTNMRKRCGLLRGMEHSRQHYVDRGISVYPPWAESYEEFATYVRSTIGERPTAKHSLDRIDNDKGYGPGNIRWATQSEQVRNSRPHIARMKSK